MSTVHVLPLRDLIEHLVPGGTDGHDTDAGRWLVIESGDDDEPICPCLPANEHVPNSAGPDRWLVIHHRLGGREASKRRDVTAEAQHAAARHPRWSEKRLAPAPAPPSDPAPKQETS